MNDIKESSRKSRGAWLEETSRDFYYALRQLRKAPGFAIVAILTVAIGIGATTAIFSIVNSVVLRPLAFPDSGRLVSLTESFLPQYPDVSPSPAMFFEWQEQTSVFASMGTGEGLNVNLTGFGEPSRVFGYRITPSYLTTLRVTPLIGRGFRADEADSGNQVAILGYKRWVESFGSRPDVINEKIFLNDEPYTVIGVMPEDFHREPGGPTIFVPFISRANLRTDFGFRSLRTVVARLKPDATIEQANRELELISRRIALAHPETNKNGGAKATPLIETQVRTVRPLLFTLLGAVGFLLLIACVNVANLLLARASSRQREIALRTALGASRGRVIRQLLCESLVIAVIGGALGALLAHQSMPVLLSFAPITLPRINEIKLDGYVLAFSCGVTLLTGLGFGLVPAWQTTRVDLTKALKDGGRGAGDGRGRHRLRNGLVIAELALALMLLVGAGLLMRSFRELNRATLGYNPELIYSTRFMLLPAKYPDDAKRVLFVDRVLAQLAGKPGIEAAAITSALPFHQNPMTLFTIEGRPETDRMKLPRGIIAMITPDYFKAMSNPLLAGRWFTERDTPDASNVAIISEQLAKEYFPGENPLGKRIDLSEPGGAKRPNSGAPKWREIVGIVSNIKTQGPAQPMIPQVYLPFAYGPQQQFMGVVRVKKGAPNPSPVVAAAVHAVDPTMPVGMAWIAEYFVHSIQVQRFALFLFSIFSGVALLLAAIGIYGMMAYSVGQRTNEIGVRLALGAQRSDIFALILKQAARLVVMGLTIGVAGSVAGSQLLRSLLYGVSPYDFATFVAIAAVFTLVAFFACWFPARRATKVDPMVALRSE